MKNTQGLNVLTYEPQTSQYHKCWDCGAELRTAYVSERRQTSGGGHGDLYPQTYEGDFSFVPVHADRRVCRIEQKRRAKLNRFSGFDDIE